MFTFPVPMTEIEEMTKNFKGKYSAGIDEISNYVVNKCTEAIKKTTSSYLECLPRIWCFSRQI
jgi:hypothetical protein